MARTKNCVDCGEYIPSRLMVDAVLVAEQQKCDLLCVRCHAEAEDNCGK